MNKIIITLGLSLIMISILNLRAIYKLEESRTELQEQIDHCIFVTKDPELCRIK